MSVIQQGLLITAIGMGLVFVVIIFLWVMMALLVRVTSKKEEMPEIKTEIQSETTPDQALALSERQRRAVAAATAVALALDSCQQIKTEKYQLSAVQGLSPWQVFHRLMQNDEQSS